MYDQFNAIDSIDSVNGNKVWLKCLLSIKFKISNNPQSIPKKISIIIECASDVEKKQKKALVFIESKIF